MPEFRPPLGTVARVTAPLSWQKLHAARKTAAARWPSPFRLPLVHRPTDVLYAGLSGKERILDVGSGDGTRRERIRAKFPGVEYVSVDTDREARADHATVEEAPGAYDVALLFEVIEHLRPETAVETLAAVRRKLRPGGVVHVSVPATHTPGRHLRDCTHVTPWAHDELGGALLLAGYELVALHRTYPGPVLRRALRRFVLGPLGHLWGLDYAHSVVGTGRRADEAAPGPTPVTS
jgi:SAM-dependent methyltransferase